MYVAKERWSVFAGLGYAAVDEADSSGVAFALGTRVFTLGTRHRWFAEASVSLVAIAGYRADPPIPSEKLYGPGLQLGYQFVSRGGFTVLVSTGVGFALGAEPDVSKTAAMGGLGLGYTWRRR
jgi:hypothetical protein